MKSFFSWLWSGFGTGMTAFRGIGMALAVALGGIWLLYVIIRAIVRLFDKDATVEA